MKKSKAYQNHSMGNPNPIRRHDTIQHHKGYPIK